MTVLMAVLVVGVVAVVLAYPLFNPAPMAATRHGGVADELAALKERKLQIYAAIRDLGFDFHTDKLEEEDYEHEVERLKAQAVGVMKQIDELQHQSPRGPESLEEEIARARDQRADVGSPDAGAATASEATAFCTRCGGAARSGDKFCSSCGSPLRTP